MVEPITTTLKGIDHIGKIGPTETIRDNLIEFFDWGFIDHGGFFNIRIPTSGSYGGNYHKLRSVIDTRYNAGQVWEGFRKNWVWESGVNTTTQPIRVSGVFVNGNFQPSSGVGTYAHHVNYPLGRIIFDNAIPTTSTVTAEYSPKWVQVFNLGDIPGLRQIQYGSFRIDDSTFFTASGNWTLPSENRVQLPAVGVVAGANISYEPLQIGGGQWRNTSVFCHIFSEDEDTGLRLAEDLSQQKDKTLNLFDMNRMASENRKSLNYDGTIASGAMTYPQLVAPSSDGGYAYKNMYFNGSNVMSNQWLNSNLYYSVVKLNTKITLDI